MAGTRMAGLGRRGEYAAATRCAIIEAARRLFAEQGYFATKVDEIAALARVASATVYTVAGGKHGLLRTLMEIWTTAPIVASTIDSIERMGDPAAILRFLAEICRRVREDYGDIMRVMLATAPHDQAVADSLAIATARYRQAFVPIAQRLADLGALRDGIDVGRAIDILWFYFGYSSLFTLHDDNGWSYEHAERWLADQASWALLRNPAMTSCG